MDRLAAIASFAAVAERGGFRAAAAALALSPTQVSAHVAALERALGVRLLNRTTRRVALTEAGEAYLREAAAAVAMLDAAGQEAAARGGSLRGRLRVNAPVSFGTRHVAPAVAAFLAAHPGVELELTLDDRRVDLVAERVDVAVRIGALSDSALIARRLAPCAVHAVASPAFVEAHGMPATPADLAALPALLYAHAAEGDRWRFTGADGEGEVRMRGRLWCNNGDALLDAALAGLGVARLPCFFVDAALADGRLARLLPGWALPEIAIHAVYPHRALPALARRFVEHLAERFAHGFG